MKYPLPVISLRRAGMQDAGIVQEILDAAPNYFLNTEGIRRDPNGGSDTLTALPPGCTNEQKFVMIIYLDHQPVGVVDLIKDFPAPGICFIGLLLLREVVQRNGLGRAAYETVEAFAIRVCGSGKLRLAVVDANPVQPFWERMGFRETGELRPHQGQKLKSTKRILEKTLPAKPKDFE